MKNKYSWIVVMFFLCQLIPVLISAIAIAINQSMLAHGATSIEIDSQFAIFVALMIDGVAAIGITLYLLRAEMREDIAERKVANKRIITRNEFGLVMIGTLLTIVVQLIGTGIMMLFGFHVDANHEDQLISIMHRYPIFIGFIVIYAPIVEEVVFRKLLFGQLKKHLRLALSIIISGLIFSLFHLTLSGFISLFGVGIVLAYVYHKSDRIIVPILVHSLMNTLVVLISYR